MPVLFADWGSILATAPTQPTSPPCARRRLLFSLLRRLSQPDARPTPVRVDELDADGLHRCRGREEIEDQPHAKEKHGFSARSRRATLKQTMAAQQQRGDTARAMAAKTAPVPFGCSRCQTAEAKDSKSFTRSVEGAALPHRTGCLLYSSAAEARAFMPRSNPEISRRRAIASAV